jgi:dTDP-4-dehydrorhamnose reductase
MTVLVIGATGMVGQAVAAAASRRGHTVVGAARSGTDVDLDVTDDAALADAIARIHPDLIVNCVAIVSLDACERDPDLAYRVNARPAAVLAEAAHRTDARLLQVSTDHFWLGDGRALHDERAPVRLVNEYARTKYAAEAFALAYPESLVVRTNVTGFRGAGERPTFIEWVVDALEAGDPMTLFDDFYTSTIDAPALAEAMFDLVDAGHTGLLNVASSQVASKKELIEAFARELGLADRNFQTASMRSMDPPRAASLGLDVSAAERALGRALPDLAQTVSALATQRRARA